MSGRIHPTWCFHSDARANKDRGEKLPVISTLTVDPGTVDIFVTGR